MSSIVNVHDAKTHFSRLLEQAHAGQEIILAKAGKPYARLMPLASESSAGKRVPNMLAGRIGFDDKALFEPMSEDDLAEWEKPL
ncbi:type II toxin-antitoxin system Phd/YefM family antitoxin [Enterobacter sp.]|uniref:type II toxin-antitoxin system Phd/YefM family antitoxin n=1 Tax=Enterobacter sp. TaxID=42895 RepID=UPI003D10F538